MEDRSLNPPILVDLSHKAFTISPKMEGQGAKNSSFENRRGLSLSLENHPQNFA